MAYGKAYASAWTAHDVALAALCAFWESLPRNGKGPKLSTEQALALAQLSAQVEAWQERIRIHRRQPLPGTMRPAPRSRARRPGGRASAPRPLRPPAPVPDLVEEDPPVVEAEGVETDEAPDHGTGAPDA